MEDVTKTSVIISSAVGIPLNLSIIFVRFLKMFQQKRTSAYQFCVCQLAIADLLVALTTAFDINVYFNQHIWLFGTTACKVIKTLQSIGFSTSGMFMMIMAYERYQGIVNPLCHRLSVRRIFFICVIVWVYTLLKFIPSFIANTVHAQQCAERNFPSRNFQIGYGIFHCATNLLIPLLVTIYYHARIFLFMRTHSKVMSGHWYRSTTVSVTEVLEEHLLSVMSSEHAVDKTEQISAEQVSGSSSHATEQEVAARPEISSRKIRKAPRASVLRRIFAKKHKKVGTPRKLKVHILLAITICFFVMTAPSNVWYFVYDLGYMNLSYRSTNYDILSALSCLLYLHCCVNGIIYSVADKKFRHDIISTYKRMFCCK